MEFCPTCGTMLQYELPHMDRPSRFSCPACPYVCNMESRVSNIFFFFHSSSSSFWDPNSQMLSRFFYTFVFIINIQVKIKRKQPLSKKEIQPIFTQDAMMEGPQTEGGRFVVFFFFLFYYYCYFFFFFYSMFFSPFRWQ